MEQLTTWLATPLWPDSWLRIWMLLAAIVLAIVVAAALFVRRRRARKAAPAVFQSEKTVITLQPTQRQMLEFANLQGLGERDEQQDAFGASPLSAYEKQGVLAVLCDGMGGMAEGSRISRLAVEELLKLFPWKKDADVPDKIAELSRTINRQFRGMGGTTLVAVLIREDQLRFWCVGDSDLFLLRDGTLYALNRRQEFRNDLLLRALEGALTVEQAFTDPQAGALSYYVGQEETRCDALKKPFTLLPGDTLLLCSDGVSDTLSLRQIREALCAQDLQGACEELERMVEERQMPYQDNYTAIAIRYHGNTRREEDENEES